MNDLVAGGFGVVVAGIGYLGVRATVKQSRDAENSTRRIEAKAIDAAAYERARQSYEAALKINEAEIDRLTKSVDRMNTRIEELQDENSRLERNKREQRAEMDNLILTLTQTRREFETHLAQCRVRTQQLESELAKLDLPSQD